MFHAANDLVAGCRVQRGKLQPPSHPRCRCRLAAFEALDCSPRAGSIAFITLPVGHSRNTFPAIHRPKASCACLPPICAGLRTPASLPLGSEPLTGQPLATNLSLIAEQLSAANSGWDSCNATVAGLQGVSAQLQTCELGLKAVAAVQQACQASQDASAAALLEACEQGRTAAEAAHQACRTSYNVCVEELRTRQGDEVRGGAGRGGRRGGGMHFRTFCTCLPSDQLPVLLVSHDVLLYDRSYYSLAEFLPSAAEEPREQAPGVPQHSRAHWPSLQGWSSCHGVLSASPPRCP